MKWRWYLTKNKTKLICVTLITATVVGTATSFIIHKRNEEYINIVKRGSSKVNESVTYEKAFNKYLLNANWITYTDSEGNRFVSISGKRFLHDKNRIANIELVYIINENNKSFKFYKGYIDKMEMNQVEALILTIRAVDTYDCTPNF